MSVSIDISEEQQTMMSGFINANTQSEAIKPTPLAGEIIEKLGINDYYGDYIEEDRRSAQIKLAKSMESLMESIKNKDFREAHGWACTIQSNAGHPMNQFATKWREAHTRSNKLRMEVKTLKIQNKELQKAKEERDELKEQLKTLKELVSKMNL